jgi:tetratricopeptide (TPR) repeat protein
VATKEWAEAIVQLEEADKAQPNNADTNNLLGFSNRKFGKLDVSLAYYKKALAVDPKHLGAHEYLGELYLMMKDPAKAKTELATLSTLCGVKCEQYLDLKKAIAAYKLAAAKKK